MLVFAWGVLGALEPPRSGRESGPGGASRDAVVLNEGVGSKQIDEKSNWRRVCDTVFRIIGIRNCRSLVSTIAVPYAVRSVGREEAGARGKAFQGALLATSIRGDVKVGAGGYSGLRFFKVFPRRLCPAFLIWTRFEPRPA